MQVVDWKIIIEKHSAIVWQTAYRLLGNHADASDCFQETFISAMKLSNRQKVKNFPALLTRLASTRAIDMLRVRFRLESNNTTTDYNYSVPNNIPDPANYAQKQELAIQLQKAIIELPVQEAQVFCMRYLNDMSYRRIANELGITTNELDLEQFHQLVQIISFPSLQTTLPSNTTTGRTTGTRRTDTTGTSSTSRRGTNTTTVVPTQPVYETEN